MKIKSLALVLTIFLGLSAKAQTENESKIYLDVGVGQSTIRLPSGADIPDPDGSAFSIAAGYKISPSFATEFGYIDFGDMEERYSNSGDNYLATIEFTGFYLGFKLGQQMGKINPYLKAGLIRWDADTSSTNLSTLVSTLNEETGTDPYYGVGVEYSFNDNSGLALEYLENDLDEESANFIGLRYLHSF